MQTTLAKLIDLYISYLGNTKNASPNTISNYGMWLKRFLWFIGDIDVNTIHPMQIMDYRKFLIDDLHLGIKTVNYHIIAIRAFLKFCIKHDIPCISPDKLEISKTPPREVHFLSDSEIEKMLSAPWDREKNEHKRTRDNAIIQILYWSGLRVSELCNLRLSDIHADSNQFSVVGKGRKMRSVFMTKSALEALSKWIEMRWWVGEYILTGISNNQKNNENEKPLSRNAIEDIIRHYAKLQGIDKKVTPHTLRHSFATSLIKKWADIRSVQTLLWHSSITTTQIYTHVDDKYLKGIHDLLN
jgi:integrase/recombinase XerD